MLQNLARRVLGVPLVAKLIGANVIIVASAVLLQSLAFSGRRAELLNVIIGLAAALCVNLLLVRLALRPIEELEDLAHRVSNGDFDARGAPSLYADKDLARLRDTVNELLDSLAAERKRIQELGAQVVEAQDIERATVSRELHDSIAQTLAAVRFQLSAAGRETQVGEMRNRLAAANGMISSAMDEIVNVSYSLHSRVAEDLGIEAALRTLARQVEERSGLDVMVRINHGAAVNRIGGATAATIYRVANEALRSSELSGRATSVVVSLSVTDVSVNIEVTDDGEDTDAVAIRPGLISMKDRVLLAGGKMTIDAAPSGGMRVMAELRTMRAAS
jgi:signal transduction histidine kinase